MKAHIIKYNPSAEYYFQEGCYILEMSNTHLDKDLSIARARVPVGVKTRLHRLNGAVERYLILQGEGEVYLDNRAHEKVSAGDVILIPKGCPQGIRNTGDCELIFLALCTPPFREEFYEDLE